MINDDTLMLYFYADGLSDTERQSVRQQLEQNAELRERYDSLCREMNGLANAAFTDAGRIDAPASAIARWRRALDEQIDSERGQEPLAWFRRRGVALAASISLVFVVGLFLGVRLANEPGQSTAVENVVAKGVVGPEPAGVRSTPAPPRVPAVFVRSVAAHLENTQIRLASMDVDNPRQRDELIRQIVSQNRFFLIAADANDAQDVARLLRAFEPLLLSMMQEGSDRKTVAEVREQLDFEMGITLTKFTRKASNQTNKF